MVPEKIGGIPAHPLIVHLPIVLGPLVGLLAVLLLVPSLRAKLAWPTAGLAVVFAVSAMLAVQSGETLAETLQLGDLIEEHEEAAEALRNIALLFAAVAVGVAALRSKVTGTAQHAAVVVLAVLGVATIGFTIKTGHEGAKAVWAPQLESSR
ncbi:MAG: hypothetical protein JHD16_03690 [Solirubrobacteraceae bacterium]|nr:hypothetical protein [Solirubrobacteraceae bacterium]